MRHALLVLLVSVCFSCQSKKDKQTTLPLDPQMEKPVDPINQADLEAEKLAKAQADEEALKAAQEIKELEEKRLQEEAAKKKDAERRRAAAKKKAALAKKRASQKKPKPQPDLSKIKDNVSDPMKTVNPAVQKKIIKKEELEQITEIAFKRNFYTFGEIVEGDTIDFTFSFTNIGEHPLLISDATATCGCTYPSFSFLPIAPGEKGEITGMYVSTGKKGAQNPMVMVTSNTDPAINKLYLDGTVIPQSEAEPQAKAPEAEATTDSLNIGG